MEVYLVGGAVRDLLMGVEPKDKDYVAVNSSREEMLDLGYEEVGKGFPVFLHPETKCEYALARKERKKYYCPEENEHQAFEFDTEFVTLEEDLLRRDLTINSIALDEKTGIFFDPYNGIRDIKEKRLIHTSSAFIEDPLRVIRVARFNARFPDFAIDKGTLAVMGAMAQTDGFKGLPKERVFGELEKALSCSNPEKFIEVLHSVGAAWHFRDMYEGFDRKSYERAIGRKQWNGKTKEYETRILITIVDLALEMLKSMSAKSEDVMLRYIAFASSLHNPDKFGKSIGAPSEWIRESSRFKKAFDTAEKLIDDDCTNAHAVNKYNVLLGLDAFRGTKSFDTFLLIADLKGCYNIEWFKSIYAAAINITIEDVCPILKGKEIGDEIKRLRIKEIEKCIKNYC